MGEGQGEARGCSGGFCLSPPPTPATAGGLALKSGAVQGPGTGCVFPPRKPCPGLRRHPNFRSGGVRRVNPRQVEASFLSGSAGQASAPSWPEPLLPQR